MKKMVFLFIVVLLSFGCSTLKKEETHPMTSVSKEALLGTWDWVKTTGGIAGITETPESTGDVLKMVVLVDSLEFVKNGTVITTGKYSIKTERSYIFNEDRPFLLIENTERYVMVLDGNSLHLIGDCADCFDKQFQRD